MSVTILFAYRLDRARHAAILQALGRGGVSSPSRPVAPAGR